MMFSVWFGWACVVKLELLDECILKLLACMKYMNFLLTFTLLSEWKDDSRFTESTYLK